VPKVNRLASKCGHPRQRRLPCATPECEYTGEKNEIVGKVITRPGLRSGWEYGSDNIPPAYLGEVHWQRGSTPIAVDVGPGAVEVFFWMPLLSKDGPKVSFRKCFDSWTLIFCPNDGAYLGKVKAYRSGLDLLVGCPKCSKKYRPSYNKNTGELDWYQTDGQHIGTSNAIPLLEYPE